MTGKLGITSIPTMHLYKDGEIVKTIVGAMPKPKLLRELEPLPRLSSVLPQRYSTPSSR